MKKWMMAVAVLVSLVGSAKAAKGPAFASLETAAHGSSDAAFENNHRRGIVLAAFGNAPAKRNKDGILVITAPKWIDSPRTGTTGNNIGGRMQENCGGLADCLNKATYTKKGSNTVSLSAFFGGIVGATGLALATGSVAAGVIGLFAGVGLGILVGAAIYGAYQAHQD